MKNYVKCLIIILSASLCFAGSLQPTAAPAPTMKTLDQVEPRTAIPGGSYSTTYTITTPGSYYLAGNRTLTTGVMCITIASDNVTLDLMGYTLTGAGSGSSSYGIFISTDRKNIKISNGSVTSFGGSGIASNNSGCKNISLYNISSSSNLAKGFNLLGGGRIENCNASDNGDTGIYAGRNSVITNCISRDNGAKGIEVSGGSVVTGCSTYNNTTNGIYVNTLGSCTIIQNSCNSNGGTGISGYVGSVIMNNTANSNGGSGIFTQNACTIIGNNTYGNTQYGISTYSYCLVDQNVAYENTTANLHLGSNNIVPSGNYPTE